MRRCLPLFVRCLLLDVCCSLLLLLPGGRWLFVVRVVCCLLSVVCCLLCVVVCCVGVRCSLFVVRCSLFVARCSLLFVGRCWWSIAFVGCLLSVVCRVLLVVCC